MGVQFARNEAPAPIAFEQAATQRALKGLLEARAGGMVRDPFGETLAAFGVDAVRLGRSAVSMLDDTEAICAKDIGLAQDWARAYRFDAIVPADGDDRPLIGAAASA